MREAVLLIGLCLSGCAFPGAVQRIAVDYNTTVAGMANEVTLLNIVRAKEAMPLQYTGFNRISGSISVGGAFKANAALKGSGVTGENTTQAAGAAVTNTIKRTVAEGVDTYTPELSGSISTGPSFDVSIYDTQKFYQGILSAIPFSTVANFLDQGFDDQLLIRLLVRRVEFKLKEALPGYGPKGTVVLTYENAPSGVEAQNFATNMACYRLGWTKKRPDPKVLMPVSRLAPPTSAGGGIRLDELAILDGQKFDLDKPIGATPASDAEVNILRVSEEKVVATLRPNRTCPTATAPNDPNSAPAALYDDNGNLLLMVKAGNGLDTPTKVAVDISITFRSTDGVIRYLGAYLEAAERGGPTRSINDAIVLLGNQPLFSVSQNRSGAPVVSARLLDRRYYILDDPNRRRNMTVLALVQQLVNLQKESGDRPTTVPVQVIP